MTVVSVEILGEKSIYLLKFINLYFYFHSLINYDINIDLLENSTSEKKMRNKKKNK